jgi:hypothetical protein
MKSGERLFAVMRGKPDRAPVLMRLSRRFH